MNFVEIPCLTAALFVLPADIWSWRNRGSWTHCHDRALYVSHLIQCRRRRTGRKARQISGRFTTQLGLESDLQRKILQTDFLLLLKQLLKHRMLGLSSFRSRTRVALLIGLFDNATIRGGLWLGPGYDFWGDDLDIFRPGINGRICQRKGWWTASEIPSSSDEAENKWGMDEMEWKLDISCEYYGDIRSKRSQKGTCLWAEFANPKVTVSRHKWRKNLTTVWNARKRMHEQTSRSGKRTCICLNLCADIPIRKSTDNTTEPWNTAGKNICWCLFLILSPFQCHWLDSTTRNRLFLRCS